MNRNIFQQKLSATKLDSDLFQELMKYNKTAIRQKFLCFHQLRPASINSVPIGHINSFFRKKF